MNPSESKTFQEKFSLLPDKIKEWLSSEELVYIIGDIETKLGLSDEKVLVIPSLILRLVVQDIEPQDFTNTLSQELGVSSLIAKTIAEEVEKNALRPIEGELRSKTGIETKLIYHPRAAEKEEAPRPSVATAKTAEGPASLPQETPRPAVQAASQPKPVMPATPSPRPISPLTFTAGPQKEIKLPEPPKMPSSGTPQTKPAAPSQPIPPVSPIPSRMPTAAPKPQPIQRPMPSPAVEPQPAAAPFILHQEASPTVAPSIAPQQHITSAPKQSLTMKIQNYYQSMGTAERPISKPVSVQTEIPIAPRASTPPAAPDIKPTPQTEQARVVHYSSFRTPITPEGTTKIEPKAPTPKAPNQNVVDLRKFM
ncbi:hypothetical protein KGO95_01530 [Patescibacteria group bacterium]|nr:hypothetical protein [Patescibacteria group bacterium]